MHDQKYAESIIPMQNLKVFSSWRRQREHCRLGLCRVMRNPDELSGGPGRPNVRTVLMRFFDERGPGFVTALTSTKGRELTVNPAVAAGLTWPAMYRAIRFRGRAVELGRDEVQQYFDSRPWASRISAWASQQSEPIGSRGELEAQYEARASAFPESGADDVPVPDFWGGFRIVPDEVEFWAGRRNRLHDRLVFTRVGEGDLGDAASWEVTRRQP